MVTQYGQSIRFPEADVRVMGRPASGVNGIKLMDGDVIMGMDIINPEEHTHILVVTQNGFGKRTPIEALIAVNLAMDWVLKRSNALTKPVTLPQCVRLKQAMVLC